MAESFVHLHVHSPYSFLDGASGLETLVERAVRLDMGALALTDHDNVSGAVEFARRARQAGLKPIQGAEVTLEGGAHLVLLAEGPGGYANLCRIITRGHLDNPRGRPRVPFAVVAGHARGLVALSGCRRGEVPRLLLARRPDAARAAALRYREAFGNRFYLELEGQPLPGSRALNRALVELGQSLGIGLVATNNVHYADRAAFWLQDLLTCVRSRVRLTEAHPERRLNAEYWLKPGAELAKTLDHLPRPVVTRALAAAGEIAATCQPALEFGQRSFPAFPTPPGETAAGMLRRLTMAGARRRYGAVTGEVARRLEHELEIICDLGYADYFLLCWDLVRFARERGIRHAGRGSAADSAVAYCLGITHVDAVARGLLFERFMSRERAQAPDIDIDFDSRYRDEVTARVYARYGRDRVATVATYPSYHPRSAIRDLGKAMGFPLAEVDRLAKAFPHARLADFQAAAQTYPELRDSGLHLDRYRRLFEACQAVQGFPRHLGTHLGGVVITRDPLTDLTPLQLSAKGVVVTQFDKVAVEDLGLIKLDLLCLRTLAAVDEAVRQGAPEFNRLPLDDAETFAMINRGDTVGVFQLESPAQRALQGRLGACHYEDIVASVAIIRPGPIKGNMVEPYIARRLGQEPVSYLHPALEPILKKTYGVVLFQEQVIEIATAVAGFTPGEADRLRRVMTHARSHEAMASIGQLFVKKAVARGVDEAAGRAIFSCMAGYASYGFCEAHAAAFANTALKNAYLVRHYPAEFFAAILSLQPMGYYPPDTVCAEARRRGVAILPVDINRSQEWFTVEAAAAGKGIRIALAQVRDLPRATLKAILQARETGGPFRSLEDFCRRVPVERDVAENLILCGAFDGLEPNRRALLWRLPGALAAARRDPGEEGPGIWEPGETPAAGRPPGVPDFPLRERFGWEYRLLGMTAGSHYMSFFRDRLRRAGYRTSAEVRELEAGARVKVAGLPVRPHRPPTRSGRTIAFLSLEDEAGLVDVTVFEAVYQRYGRLIFQDPVPPLEVEGRVERRGRHVAVVADRVLEFRPKQA